MKRILPFLLAGACLAHGAGAPVADTIVILKFSAPISFTRYEVENASANPNDINDADGDGKPYARKNVSYSETWAYYDIHNVTTGELVSLSYYTYYSGATAVRRYEVGAVENGTRYLDRSYFYRLASANTAPTYNFISTFNEAGAFGGPDDPNNPGNVFDYYQFWQSLIKGAQPITTVIAAKTTPPTPAVRVLLPSGAKGIHQGFRHNAFFPGPPGGLSTTPTNRRFTIEKGTTTLSYDSVLTGKANAALAANVHVFDYTGAEIFPRTLAYGVKVVRDALEALGYEIESDLDND